MFKYSRKQFFLIATTLFLVVFLFSGCKKKNDIWTGTYYPDGCLVCEKDYVFSPPFNSLDDCRNWVNKTINSRKDGSYDYECGKNCKPDKELGDYGILTCEETRK